MSWLVLTLDRSANADNTCCAANSSSYTLCNIPNGLALALLRLSFLLSLNRVLRQLFELFIIAAYGKARDSATTGTGPLNLSLLALDCGADGDEIAYSTDAIDYA